MRNILSPADHKKKLLNKKISISKHNINFENFKNERIKKFRNFSIVMVVIFVFANFLPAEADVAGAIFGGLFAVIFILGSPAIVQYVRGNLNWTTWIWYCLGMCMIGIGFIFLFFMMPPEDRLEQEYKEFELKKIKI